jgi:hypothetical protein
VAGPTRRSSKRRGSGSRHGVDDGGDDDRGLVTLVEPNGGYLCATAMGDIVTFGRTGATMPPSARGWE